MTIIERAPLGDTAAAGFTVEQVTVRRPDGHQWSQPLILKRSALPPAMAVTVRDDGAVLMVRTWRTAVDGYEWELPGGRAEEGDLDVVATAAREVLEETGQPTGGGTFLGWVHPMSSLITTRVAAVRLHASGPPSGVRDMEGCDVEWFTPADLSGLIGRGDLRCGISLAVLALHWTRTT